MSFEVNPGCKESKINLLDLVRFFPASVQMRWGRFLIVKTAASAVVIALVE